MMKIMSKSKGTLCTSMTFGLIGCASSCVALYHPLIPTPITAKTSIGFIGQRRKRLTTSATIAAKGQSSGSTVTMIGFMSSAGTSRSYLLAQTFDDIEPAPAVSCPRDRRIAASRQDLLGPHLRGRVPAARPAYPRREPPHEVAARSAPSWVPGCSSAYGGCRIAQHKNLRSALRSGFWRPRCSARRRGWRLGLGAFLGRQKVPLLSPPPPGHAIERRTPSGAAAASTRSTFKWFRELFKESAGTGLSLQPCRAAGG